MASSCRSASAAASPNRSSISQQCSLKYRREQSQIRHLHDMRDSLKNHFACSSCMSVFPANSFAVWWKHSTASNVRSIVSRRSQITRQMINLGAVNSKATECWADGAYRYRGKYLRQQRHPRHLSTNYSLALLLPILSRVACGLEDVGLDEVSALYRAGLASRLRLRRFQEPKNVVA